MDVVKNTQSKIAMPLPQRSKQAAYVIPHASEKLEVRVPSGFTRNAEVEELERARERARAAHWVLSKLEAVALGTIGRERKRKKEIDEQRRMDRAVMTAKPCKWSFMGNVEYIVGFLNAGEITDPQNLEY